MLQQDDIEFVIKALDAGSYKGIAACHKVVEVFLKLQQLNQSLAALKVKQDEQEASKEVV